MGLIKLTFNLVSLEHETYGYCFIIIMPLECCIGIYTTFFVTSTTTKTPGEELPDSRRGFGDWGPPAPSCQAADRGQPGKRKTQHVTCWAVYNYIGTTPIGDGGFKNGGESYHCCVWTIAQFCSTSPCTHTGTTLSLPLRDPFCI